MYELQNALKNWKKKVEIIEIAAKRTKLLSSKLKSQSLHQSKISLGNRFNQGSTSGSLDFQMSGGNSLLSSGR